LALYDNRSPLHSCSSTFLTQALFELASLPSSDIDSIRAEVTHALEEEGGWTKAALARFHKIDSVLKEVGRVHGVFERMSQPLYSHICHNILTEQPNSWSEPRNRATRTPPFRSCRSSRIHRRHLPQSHPQQPGYLPESSCVRSIQVFTVKRG